MNATNKQRLLNGEAAAENVNLLLQSVSYSSMAEIECVISELQAVRDALCGEGERVLRVASDHAGTSRAAAASMRIVADGLKQLKNPIPDIDHEPR